MVAKVGVFWSLLLLLAFTCYRASSDVVAQFDDPAIAAAVEAQDATPESTNDLGPIQRLDIPTERPPFSSQRVWCGYNCATRIIVKTGSQIKGALELDIRYKPIAGVNSSMMVWMFENLHQTARYKVNNKTYAMYLIFHPVDHMFNRVSSTPITTGTKLTWCEIALTGCRYNRSSATEPYICPPRRSGFLRSSPEQQWSSLYQSKVEMTVSFFNTSGIEFYSQRYNSLLGPEPRTMGFVRQTWSDSPQGLRLRTFQRIGLMKPDSFTEFDEKLGPLASLVIAKEYIKNATNIANNNMTQVGWLAALHFLQEYSGLGFWLPQLYAGRTRR